MKKILFALIILLNPLHTFSQEKITGAILDSISQIKLPYSTITFLNENDSIIYQVIANENGEFKANCNELFFKVIIAHLGYNDKVLVLQDHLGAKKKNIKLGKIPLELQVTDLDEISVVGKLPYYEQKFDRKVFNISQHKAMSANTIYDLLRVLPGVTVDESGSIRYNGASPKIYIDNQPYNFIYPSIEQIPVSLVHKIELVDASMLYGDVGKGGIINIKLKMATDEGLSGLASVSANTVKKNRLNKFDAFSNLNYKIKKLIIYNNGSYTSNYLQTTSETNRTSNTFNYSSLQNIKTFGDNKSYDYYDYFGINYDFSKNTKLYAGGGIFNYDYNNNSQRLFNEHDDASINVLNSYVSVIKSKSEQDYAGANIMFYHIIDTSDRYFWVNSNIQFSGYNNIDTSNYNYYLINSQTLDSNYSLIDKSNFKLNNLSSSFFYNHPFNKKMRFNLHYVFDYRFKGIFRYNRFVFNELSLPLSKTDDGNTLNQGLSLRVGSIIKKWKLDAGLKITSRRLSGHYTRHLNNNDTVINLEKIYFKLSPSATIKYILNSKEEIKLTFTDGYKLPYSEQLIDYVDKSNPSLWFSGNPNLKPGHYYSTYLGYTYFKESFNLSANTFFKYTNNGINSIIYPLNSLVSLSKPENSTEESTLGIDASSWFKISSKANISASSSLYHIKRNDLFLSEVKELNLPFDNSNKQRFGFYIRTNFQYEYKKIYFTLYLSYKGKEISYYGYNYERFNSSLNLFKSFFNNRLNLTFNINNITYDLFPNKSYSNRFGMEGYTFYNGSSYKRTFFLSIKYKFRQGDRNTKDNRI